ncbi:MAG: HlyD family efflux transporter periplasmic adaptor subunit [Lachnospiraceae bacterium]|nr:HlyD family efflux transporter periplasmic adaptor subunit [Lachnospiraceae bacterium]
MPDVANRDEEIILHPVNKKKRILIAICVLILLGGIGAAVWFFFFREFKMPEPEIPVQLQGRTDLVAATGTTMEGVTDITVDTTFLQTDLIVDEVFVSDESEVQKGDKVLTITDTSYKAASRELERAELDAGLAYRQGLIDYETKKLEAKETYDKSLVEAELAETTMNDAIAVAEISVQKAEKELKDANKLLEEYQSAVDDNYYYTKYEVDRKKSDYEKNLQDFFDKLEDWGYELDDGDTSAEGYEYDPDNFTIVGAKKKGMSIAESGDGEETVLQLLKDEYQKNKDEYDDALEDAEAATEKARAGLSAAQDDAALKTLALEEAKIKLEKDKTEAANKKAESEEEGKRAKATYDQTIKKLDEDLKILNDAQDEATENRAYFAGLFEDGAIYTKNAGTIMYIDAAAGKKLASGFLMAYTNTDTLSVHASVDQTDIAKLNVGDTATIVLEGKDPLTGKIKAIDPVSKSDSKASVSYNVTVEMEAGDADVDSNMTATVYFGIDADEYNKIMAESGEDALMISSPEGEGGRRGGRPSGGPSGMPGGARP